MEKLTDREIVDAVLARGIDWLFQTIYNDCGVEAEYIARGKKPVKIRAVELERIKTEHEPDKRNFGRGDWKFDQSLLLMATDTPDVVFKSWPGKGDRIKYCGRLYEVSAGFQLISWYNKLQLTPAIRIFMKEIIQ